MGRCGKSRTKFIHLETIAKKKKKNLQVQSQDWMAQSLKPWGILVPTIKVPQPWLAFIVDV
jgi:hypothetical protein